MDSEQKGVGQQQAHLCVSRKRITVVAVLWTGLATTTHGRVWLGSGKAKAAEEVVHW